MTMIRESQLQVVEAVDSIQIGENWTLEGLTLHIKNIVGSIDVQTPLDLKTIALHARNAEYNPRKFAAVIMRLRDPKTTALIFSSGKIVVTGASSESNCRLAARKYCKVLQKLNFPAKYQSFKVCNIMGTSDVRFPIRLEGLLNDHSRFCTYEPELFAGLIFKLVDPKLTFLIFVSGKLVICGAKDTGDMYTALEKMYPLLLEYRKMAPAPTLAPLDFQEITSTTIGCYMEPSTNEFLKDIEIHENPIGSPTHRRNTRQYSLPTITFPNFKFSKEDRSPLNDKKKSPGRHRRIPSSISRAFQRILEDDGHTSDPGPIQSDDKLVSQEERQRSIESDELYLPDTCSGLKDQFLRIKERFTKTSNNDITMNETQCKSNEKSMSSASLRDLDAQERRRLTGTLGGWIDPRNVLDPTRNEEIAMKPMELMHELAKLNASAQKLFADDPWSHGAERWVLEGSNLRGYMTCWTIERGGELVVIIAQTIKSLNATVHPDISLQWIGRQLYGLTIQLPLARNGELSMEHITVASGIDVALAKMQSLAEASPVWPAPSPTTFEKPKAFKVEPLHREKSSRHLTSQHISVQNLPKEYGNGMDKQSLMKAHHIRSLSTDSNSVPYSSTTLARSLSSDLRGDAIHHPPPLHHLPSTISSTKTVQALTTPATSLFEDDPFQRCTPDKIGWLKKRSSGLNSWQLRWFELKGNRLYYFKSEKDGIPRGAIVLDKVHCVKEDAGELIHSLTIAPSSGDFICMMKFSNRMTYHTYSRRSCTLRVSDDDEMDIDLNGWINAICRASFHCYLALPPSPPGKVKKNENKMYKYSSFQYLRETDPLLWEINPFDQTAIRKKAATASSIADYTILFTKFAFVFKYIVLPRPRPISIEQTLRDIIPEIFLINNILYGGGETESIDHIFQVLEGYVRRFSQSHDECVDIVSSILQACARTIGGGDSYFVVRSLLGSTSIVIRPANNYGMPIVIDISSANPTIFTITLQSEFLFHTIDTIDKMGQDDIIEPICRIQTLHVQEIDFKNKKSNRYIKIRHLLSQENDPIINHQYNSSQYNYGALLDGLG